jgi:hypothetical protein
MFSLTGCIQEYKVTDQLGDATAEYMAGLILDSDKNYDQDLTPRDDLEEETATSEEVATSPSPMITPENGTTTSVTEGQDATTQKDYTLTEIIGEKNFEIEYTGYEITETYPEDTENTYFSLTPREGNQLIVASFIVKNKSSKKKALNLSKAEILYQLDVNESTVYKPSLTLLENNLQYIDLKIDGGKAEPVLLIFEVSKDIELTKISLLISKDGKSDTIKIK